ncbi:MAG: cyclopropane-fatty-acyl-phospholipid synthase family protein [Bacteroidales bacterium]
MEEFNKIPNDSIENNFKDKTLLIENLDISVVIGFFRQMERQGPGSDEVTLRAFSIIEESFKEEGFSPAPFYRIADMGCGTGGQSMTLARNPSASITAFDIFPGMIETLNRRVSERGLNDRVRGVVASMDNIPSEEIPSGNLTGMERGFDIIWSEGSIYHIGFENGLKLWREYLRDGGYIAVSEMVWLTQKRPSEFEKYLSDNVPEISLPSVKMGQIESAGYTPVASFLLPWSCWSETYLRPMEALFEKFLDSQNQSAGAIEFVKRQREEIFMFEKYREYFGYMFFIVRKVICQNLV